MQLEIIKGSNAEQETSTITMERSRDEAILEAFSKYFDNGGQSLRSKEDFLHVWKSEIDMVHRLSSPKSDSNDIASCDMPSLQTSEELGFMIPGTGHLEEGMITDMLNNNQYDNAKEETKHDDELGTYEGDEDCGECELVFNNCSTHNHLSIMKEFGPEMKCVGNGCGKTLLQCLNEGQCATRGAYVCKKCADHECRQMKCTFCYFKGDDSGSDRKSRRRQM